MSGISVVYLVFAIVIASIFGYMFLLSRRQREIEEEVEELKEMVRRRGPGGEKQGTGRGH